VHTVSYKFPSLNYALGKTSSDNIGPGVAPDSPTGGVDLSSGYSVELSGQYLFQLLCDRADLEG
jgi:hypothetical protein